MPSVRRFSVAPSSRSTRVMMFLTVAPRARTACITDAPSVVTSSNRMTLLTGLKFAVDLSLGAVVFYLLAHHEAVDGAAMPAAGAQGDVTRGHDLRVHLLLKSFIRSGWIAGSSPAMTRRAPLTHPRKAHLLSLIQRLVEARERGADCGGGGAHGGEPLAHRLHAADRGERGLGGAGGGKRVGGFERGGDELVEGNA